MNQQPSDIALLSAESLTLLSQLISIPSFSKEEDKTADRIQQYLITKGIPCQRLKNNVWATNLHFDKAKPTLLLNSHHDTVRPNKGYTCDPFKPIEKEGKLFGLGANDAGGPLVCLLAAFLYYYEKEMPCNFIFVASAEEEISGREGIELVLKELPEINCGIVGEPTLLQMAVAEKGLLVLEGVARGKAGHAAREEGINALYIALEDINWLRRHRFERISALLGPVHVAVTSMNTPNQAHNVVPSECSFLVDIRVNECYSFEEILEEINTQLTSEIKPRSLRLKPSFIEAAHPLVRAGKKLGLNGYGSPTCSDMALMDFPAIKIGPGDSARSHTADEFIFVKEIEEGVATYISLIENFGKELISIEKSGS